jgi:predicted ATPase/DNA-binding SARP family transcriptional activator/Tfp pilus assembly protein PilF
MSARVPPPPDRTGGLENQEPTGRLDLLGPVTFTAGARSWPFTKDRPHQLLLYVATQSGWVARDQLAALFWPDRPNHDARRNLRRILHTARRLEYAGGLEQEADLLRWSIETDLALFERALREGRPLEAISLMRGALAEGMDDVVCEGFNDWLAFERNRLIERFRAVALNEIQRAAPADALAIAERLMVVDPVDDDALRAKLEALSRLGRLNDARSTYAAFSRRLAEELGVQPSVATLAVAARLASEGETARATPSRSPASTPAPTGELVGRASDLLRLQALVIDRDARLLAITGPGGVGKTRLARAVLDSLRAEGSELSKHFPDGGVWVDLSDLGASEHIAPRLAAVLSLRLEPKVLALPQVVARLAEARQLVVFDNCEHLIGGTSRDTGLAGITREIEAGCPHVKVLATSRRRLGAGEQVLTLSGLRTLPADSGADAVLASESAQLFCERARAALACFDASRSARAIGTICVLTEGLPLALELAAAWVRVLSCAEIAEELRAGLDVLEPRTGDRGMRAVFERSWRLAAEHERGVLAQLTVFAGSFSREAARAVAGASLAALANLVDASLLRAEERGERTRFSLHPLLRDFAKEKLRQQRGAEAAVLERHAEYYRQFLQRHEEADRLDHKAALGRMECELADCIEAWRWALRSPSPLFLVTATRPLERYFNTLGRIVEGIALFEEALAALEDDKPGHAAALAGVEASLGLMLFRAGTVERAEPALRRALARARLHGLRRVQKSSLNSLALTLSHRGRWMEARDCFADALALARADRDDDGVATFLGGIAMMEKALGHVEAAQAMYEEVIAINRSSNNLAGLATALNNLGNLLRLGGRLESSNAAFLESLALAEASDLKYVRPYALVNLGLTAYGAGDGDAARGYAMRALDAARAAANAQIEASALALLARLAVRDAEVERGHALLAEAMRIALKTGIAPIEDSLLAAFAEVLAARGEVRRAAAIWAHFANSETAEVEVRTTCARRLEQLGATDRGQAAADHASLPRRALIAEIVSQQVEIRHAADPLVPE